MILLWLKKKIILLTSSSDWLLFKLIRCLASPSISSGRSNSESLSVSSIAIFNMLNYIKVFPKRRKLYLSTFLFLSLLKYYSYQEYRASKILIVFLILVSMVEMSISCSLTLRLSSLKTVFLDNWQSKRFENLLTKYG